MAHMAPKDPFEMPLTKGAEAAGSELLTQSGARRGARFPDPWRTDPTKPLGEPPLASTR
jgi:hypothetical protein